MGEKGKKYKLGGRLGGGGMAEVFRGTLIGEAGFMRPIALKRIHPGLSADPTFAQMFVSEAHIASRLAHPNIVSVLDFDRDESGHLFLVMELVEGKDLHQLIETGPLPIPVAVHIVAEVLRALSYAHELHQDGQLVQIIHRDVSPHNVMISWMGSVKLTDFGIAKAAAASSGTHTGVVKGKAAYLSPEQVDCLELDERADLFALGVVLHELLTGRRLFGVRGGAPDPVIIRRVLSLEIESPRRVRPEISEQLEAVCLGLLERDRTRRFPTAAAALEALRRSPELSVGADLELASLMCRRFPAEAPSRRKAPEERDPATPPAAPDWLEPTMPSPGRLEPGVDEDRPPRLLPRPPSGLDATEEAQTVARRARGRIFALAVLSAALALAGFGVARERQGRFAAIRSAQRSASARRPAIAGAPNLDEGFRADLSEPSAPGPFELSASASASAESNDPPWPERVDQAPPGAETVLKAERLPWPSEPDPIRPRRLTAGTKTASVAATADEQDRARGKPTQDPAPPEGRVVGDDVLAPEF